MTSEAVDTNTAHRFLPRFSWAMYDFANTIYAFIVMTLAGARYFDAAGIGGELYYGISFFASMIVSGFVVPLMGALSDRIGHPKLGVILLTIIAVTTMFCMGLTQNLMLLVICLFVGNLAYQSSLVLYDSLLPLLIRNNNEAGKVSGMGVGLGYLGSIVAAGLVMIILPKVMFNVTKTEHLVDKIEKSYYLEVRQEESVAGVVGKVRFNVDEEGNSEIVPKSFKLDENTDATGAAVKNFKKSRDDILIEDVGDKFKITSKTGKFIKLEYNDDKFADAFYLGAVLFLLTAVPFALFVPERRIKKLEPAEISSKTALSQVLSTLKSLPSNKPLFYFLIAAFMCQDVQNTAISYLAKVTHSVYMPTESEIMIFLLLVNASAALFSFFLGYLTDKLGARTVLILGAFGTLFGLLLTVFIPRRLFYVMAVGLIIGGGLGIAAFWTAGRKLLLNLAPPNQIGEYFGFLNFTKKFAVIGIILLPTIKLIAYQSFHFSEAISYRVAIAGQLPLLIIGIIFLFRIKVPKKSDADQLQAESESV